MKWYSISHQQDAYRSSGVGEESDRHSDLVVNAENTLLSGSASWFDLLVGRTVITTCTELQLIFYIRLTQILI